MEKESKEPKEETPKKKNRTGVFVAIVILLVAGIASAAWWANNSESIEDLTPEEATALMTEKLLNLESGRMSADVDLEYDDPEEAYREGEFQQIEEAMGIENTDNIVLEMNAAFDTREGAKKSDVGVEMGLASGDERSVIALNAVTVDGNINYVRMQLPESLVDLFAEELDGFDISFANNTWVEINLEELIKTLNLEELLAQEGMDITQLLQPMSEEDRKAFIAVFQNNMFLPLKERVGEEKIDGVKTFKYKVGIDVEKGKTFLVETLKMSPDMYEKLGYPEETITEIKNITEMIEKDFDVNEAKEMVAKMEAEGKLEMYAWLDSKNGELHQAQLIIKNTGGRPDENSKVTFTMNLSEHNEDVQIEVPEDSMSVEALIGEFVLRAAGTSLEGASDSLQNITAPEKAEEPVKPKKKAKKEKKEKK